MAKSVKKETPVLISEKTEDEVKNESFLKEYLELCKKHDRVIASGVKFDSVNFQSFITSFFKADLQVIKKPKDEGAE